MSSLSNKDNTILYSIPPSSLSNKDNIILPLTFTLIHFCANCSQTLRGKKNLTLLLHMHLVRKTCAFVILQVHFQIAANPSQLWDQEIISSILMVSVLFHNTILKDEYNENLESFEFGRNIQMKHKLSFVNLRQGTQTHRKHRIALSINE